MSIIPHTRIYLASAMLAAISYPAGPASGENLSAGDLKSPSAVQEAPAWFKARNSTDIVDDYKIQKSGPDDFGPEALLDEGIDVGVTPEDMSKSWCEWHRRVSDVVRERFKRGAAMVFKDSSPRICSITYVVASDGRIGNVRVLAPYKDGTFDNLAKAQIRSMNADPVLEFPSDSKRKFVRKFDHLFWNLHHSNSWGDFDGLEHLQQRSGPSENGR